MIDNFKSQISAEKLGISQERRARYIEMPADVGCIKDISIYKDALGETVIDDIDI